MGKLREAYNNTKCPSVWFGFSDLPEGANILLNDIDEMVLIKRKVDTEIGSSEVIDIYSYDEYKEKLNGEEWSREISR